MGKKDKMAEIPVSPYDNDTSIMYKYAQHKGVPVKYVRSRPLRSEDPSTALNLRGSETLFSISDLLPDIRAGKERALNDITLYAPDLNPKDIAGLYLMKLGVLNPTEENLLDVNNFYSRLRPGLEGFDGLQDLRTFYTHYLQTFNDALQDEGYIIQGVIENQKIFEVLAQEPSLPISPITVGGKEISFHPTLGGERVDMDNGPEIFNQTVLSPRVPFIQYNDGERKYYKVYKGETMEELPDLRLISSLSANNNEKHKLFLTLWTGDPQDTGKEVFYRTPKNSFTKVEYNLGDNTLLINVPLGESNLGPIAIARIQKALPILTLGEGSESKLGGWFDLFFIPSSTDPAGGQRAIALREVELLDTLINNELMPYYFYTEERTRPLALKKNVDINYRSLFEEERVGSSGDPTSGAIVATKIKLLRAEVDETHQVLEGDKAVSRILPRGTYYIHVKITKAANRKVLDEFIRLFRLLMIYHELDQRGITFVQEDGKFVKRKAPISTWDQYKKYIPELSQLDELESIGATETSTKGPSKNEQLQEIAPDLFVKGYGRRCLCPNQPIIIPKKDVAEWESYPYMESGVPMKRTIRRYPDNDNGWYFACPGDNHPHMNFKENRSLNNKDKYPFLPCCSKTPLAPGEYPKPKVGAKAENIIITQKFVQPGGLAKIPKHVSAALKTYLPGTINSKILRQGVIRSTNSFLHSVCIAIEDSGYLSLPDHRREEYVKQLRLAIAKDTNPELVKQELYDYSNIAINKLLKEVDVFYDPLLFYRAVEEYFQINIYTFSTSPEDDEVSEGRMLIPRHTKFHAHTQHIERKTVLIFRNLGSESDLLPYPQCELIVHRFDEGKGDYELVTSFGREMTELCHGIMIDTLGTITWDDVHRTNPDLYAFVDYNSLIDNAGTGQHLDGDGRMRGLNFKLLKEGKTTEVTMFFPPAPPANLPETKIIHYPDPEIILGVWNPELFSSTARNSKKPQEVVGLWYRVFSLQEGVFFPIKPTIATGRLAEVPIGPASLTPIKLDGSITKRVRSLERTLNLLMQLVEWLYLIHCRGGLDLEGFYHSYFGYDPLPVLDSADYYDFSNLPRRLPSVNSVPEGIEVMSRYASTLFNNGKIAMYSASFASKVYKTLKGNLTLSGLVILRLSKGEAPDKGINHLRGYYLYEEDFRSQPYVSVFIGSGNLNRWINSLTIYRFERVFRVYTVLRSETISKLGEKVREPYIYNQGSNYYLIQNVATGSKEAAAAISKTWIESGYNPGYDVTPLDPEELQLMKIYKEEGGRITLEADLTRGLASNIEILHYNNGRYASLIRLV